MTSTTFHSISSPRDAKPTVGEAWQALWVASKSLALALAQWAFGNTVAGGQTRFEQAEELRTYAASIQKSDPDFALDLFAAADRHEGL